MVARQSLNRPSKIAQIAIADANPEQPAIILHHSNASAAVRRVDHDEHGAIARKDIAQCAKACVWVAQMMKHACANDLIERLAKLADALDRKPLKTQISYVMLLLKFSRVAQTCFADIYRCDTRVGLHERMTRGLRRAAAGDENGSIWPRLFQRPQQQILRAAPARIAVAIEALIEAGDWRRIGVRLVESANRSVAIGRFGIFTLVWHA
jgi:hypothetical protein